MISFLNIQKALRGGLGCLLALSAASCHHKDLYFPEPQLTSHLQVVFDWQKAPDAEPESMAAYLFDSDGHEPLRFIFDNKTGGEIKAPAGIRHILFMNSDNTDWICMRNNEYIETMELYTLDATGLAAQGLEIESVPRSRDAESERMASTPGMLWGGRSDGHNIIPNAGNQTITLYPDELICHYTVDVLDVDNIDGLASTSVDATLSGMADGYSLGGEAPTDSVVTMPFILSSDPAKESLHGEFLTFGECSHSTNTHLMTIYLLLSDGSRWWHTYDVTDQVSTAPDPRHVHIVVSGLPLPERPKGGGTSVSPDVNEWQVVNIGLNM